MTPWDLSESLERAAPDESWHVGARFFADRGIDCAMLIRRSDAGVLSVRSTLRSDWMTDHAAAIRVGRDPFVRWCLPSWRSQPTGADVLERHDGLGRRERDLIRSAVERSGLRAGRSVILRADPGGSGPAVGWHLLTRRSGREFERQFGAQGTDLALGCHMIAAHLEGSAKRRADGPCPLTPRERECLQFIAAGDRVAAIAHRLALSEATVEAHLANARKRLGSRTTGEAVARAVRSGAIDL